MIRVLQICNKPPLPKIDGGCVAINNISEGLLNHPEVKLKILTVETEKHPFIKENYPASYIKQAKIEAVYIDTRVNFVDAFSSYITSDSYNVIRFFSPSFDKRLAEILEENVFDIIHIESIFITPYIHTIRRFSDAKIVLRSHNIEHKLWEHVYKNSRNPFKKLYLYFLHKELKKYEVNIIKDVDAVASISPSDKTYLEATTDKLIAHIPLGIEVKEYKKSRRTKALKLFHIGAMDWTHNKKAIDWFIEEVWPKIREEYPEMELHLAGKDISLDYHIPRQNIFCHGEVENAAKFMQKHDVLIIPLKTASGLRIKIIEAMALGRLVISTSVGIRGIEVKEYEHYLKANKSKEFIEAIASIKQDYDMKSRIEKNAFTFVKEQYANDSVIHKLVQFYQSVL